MAPTWTVPDAGAPAYTFAAAGAGSSAAAWSTVSSAIFICCVARNWPSAAGGGAVRCCWASRSTCRPSEAIASCWTERRTRTAPATSESETATMTARPIAPNRRARSDLTDG